MFYFSLQSFFIPFIYRGLTATPDPYPLLVYALFFSCLGLVLFSCFFSLWHGSEIKIFQVIKKSVLFFFIVVPLSLFVANMLFFLINLFSAVPYEVVDQEAVHQMKELGKEPLRFWTLALLVGIAVPMAEEILFRGFFQSWLVRYISVKGSILVTSTCFSLLHISQAQGMTNISIFFSIFTLSLFLGYLYHTEKTLFAPVILHSLFNCTTIFFVYTQVS